ncbi:hypothetical protein [Mycobacterium hubeiense]|uniref:hypothetical protein n=1 Tax=Mycobacterium hubeiense TaxID=1867256 RepID=UPI001E3008E9|nr:hypothetical protein [Mycobacterium sp. QGD 101]
MTDQDVAAEQDEQKTETVVAVDTRVRVHPDTDNEVHGVVVEDFGDSAGYSVDIGEKHIANAARRWAVMLDSGTLEFVDSDDLVPE